MQNDILRTVEIGGVVILGLLDLSAAFDTIDHAILLECLQTLIGIDGMAHAWFASYLTGRMQRVRIGEAWSLAKFLLFCIPQGSVLGPLLFLIYILPLHGLNLSHGLSMHGYADDTQILSISDTTNFDSVRRECLGLEKCLADNHCWMSANRLKLKAEKTEVLVVGTSSKLKSLDLDSLTVAGFRFIITGKPVRNLGVMMDQHMAISAQVRQVVQNGIPSPS